MWRLVEGRVGGRCFPCTVPHPAVLGAGAGAGEVEVEVETGGPTVT